MNFKIALVLSLAALCAVQAAPGDDHERNRRDALDMLNAAKGFASNIKTKIVSAAQNGLKNIANAYEQIEDKVLDAASSVLKKVGVNYDLNALFDTLKGNIKACALSDEVKTKAVALKDNVLSCISDEVTVVRTIIDEISTLASAADGVPAVIQNAVNTCTGADGESFSIGRLANCATALKGLSEESVLVSIPEAIAKNVKKAGEIAVSIKDNGASCVVNKIKGSGPAVIDIVKSVGSCVKARG